MDIFSLPKEINPRQKPFVYPLASQLKEGEDVVEAINLDIQQRFKEVSDNFEKYLKQKYAEIDYKRNKCLYNCFKGATQRSGMKQCRSLCGAMERKLPVFIESNTSHMNELLNECLNNKRDANHNDIFRCYDSYIRGFTTLKLKIEEESKYYQ